MVRSKSATAEWIAWAADASPRCSSIMAADKIAASGLAIPFPVMFGAEPWTGSKRLGWRLVVGSLLPLAARPRLPTMIADRSVRINDLSRPQSAECRQAKNA